MNKRFLIILGAATVLTVGCSKKNAPDGPVFEDWVNNESLPVPINIDQRAFDATLTKAAPIESSNIEGTLFGVFGIDLAPTNDLPEDAWSADASQVLLYDKYAEFQDNRMRFVESTGPVTYYYPMITRYNYTFYGFHTSSATTLDAYKNDFHGYFEGNSLCTDINLGRTDILWAKASAEDITGKLNESDAVETTLKGFNAKYARYSRRWYPDTYSEKQPMLEYQHLTSAIHFYATAEDAEAEASLAGKVTIKNLRVIGVPTKAKLCIASKDDPAQEGKLTAIGEKDTLKIYDSADRYDDLGVTPVVKTETVPGAEVGEGMFILPCDSEGIEVYFTLRAPISGSPASGYVYEDIPVKSAIPTPLGSKFEAGKRYNFTILIRSLEEIIIIGGLQDWEDGEFEGDNQVADIG